MSLDRQNQVLGVLEVGLAFLLLVLGHLDLVWRCLVGVPGLVEVVADHLLQAIQVVVLLHLANPVGVVVVLQHLAIQVVADLHLAILLAEVVVVLLLLAIQVVALLHLANLVAVLLLLAIQVVVLQHLAILAVVHQLLAIDYQLLAIHHQIVFHRASFVQMV